MAIYDESSRNIYSVLPPGSIGDENLLRGWLYLQNIGADQPNQLEIEKWRSICAGSGSICWQPAVMEISGLDKIVLVFD